MGREKSQIGLSKKVWDFHERTLSIFLIKYSIPYDVVSLYSYNSPKIIFVRPGIDVG